MADIGSILLPDPNLMDNYQRSFDKQMALKQYVAQDSRQQEQQFAKESMFMPDADLQAYKGQSAAMALNVQKYMQHRQELSADRSRGGFFGLDPKAQAELAAEKYSLMQDQEQRLQAIKNITSAKSVINRADFPIAFDPKNTEEYIKQVSEGKIPNFDILKRRPIDLEKLATDFVKPYTDDIKQSIEVRNGNGTTTRTYSGNRVLNGGSDKITDPKTYQSTAFKTLTGLFLNNDMIKEVSYDHYMEDAKDNPDLLKQFGTAPTAGVMYMAAKKKDFLMNLVGAKSSMGNNTDTPKDGTTKKIVTPDGNIADFSGYSIKLKLPDKSDATGRQQNDVSVGTWSLDGKKATVYKTARVFNQKTQMWNSNTTEEVITDPTELHRIKNAIDNSHVTINGNFTTPTSAGKGKRIGKITGSN